MQMIFPPKTLSLAENSTSEDVTCPFSQGKAKGRSRTGLKATPYQTGWWEASAGLEECPSSSTGKKGQNMLPDRILG